MSVFLGCNLEIQSKSWLQLQPKSRVFCFLVCGLHVEPKFDYSSHLLFVFQAYTAGKMLFACASTFSGVSFPQFWFFPLQVYSSQLPV
jgi:hypothetical protein